MRLLIDAGEFMGALRADLEGATTSVLAQTMSFEGDQAGLSFANLLIRSRCRRKQLLVDCYSRHVLSCRFVHGPGAQRDAELIGELRWTAATHEALRRAGVQVRFVHPAGILLRRFPARNHKKSIVIDGHISYIGGMNISDHNFAWHDMMLRIDDARVGAFLEKDLGCSWESRTVPGWADFDGIAIGMTDGSHNERIFERVFDAMARATGEIVVQTPFLTFPFTDRLVDARRRGVRVRVIAPSPHPWRSIGRYVEWECARSGFDLALLPGMTHVKAMLIDRKVLVMGSSNFDYLSYRRLHEILAIVDEPHIVNDFARRIADVDLRRSHRRTSRPDWAGHMRRYCLEAAGAAVAYLSA
jgi:cardiolipin synthase